MAKISYPGTSVEEIEAVPRVIKGVPTSIAAILGETERGPIEPKLVTSCKEYLGWYGDVYDRDQFMPYAIAGFFENGGKSAYICRLVGEAATTASADFGAAFSVEATGAGEWGKRVYVEVLDSTTKDGNGNPIGFRIRLSYRTSQKEFDPAAPFDPVKNQIVEDFDDLVTDENSPDFYAKRFPFIDSDKGRKKEGPNSSVLGVLVRKNGAALNALPDRKATLLTDGGAEDAVEVDDYVGEPAGSRTEPQGLDALKLDPYRDVALVYAPNATTDVATKIISHCELMKFRFAILDAEKSETVNGLDPRTTLADSSFAAFYYPWIVISDPRSGVRKLVPPGGHVLGVYARTDVERGVFKAPANEVLRGAIDVAAAINDATQDKLYPRGVNVIRRIPGRGIRVCSARTLTSNALWKYVSFRRLFIFLECSIYEATRWVAFEPNDPRLWAWVTDTVRMFLRTQWRLGTLYGQTEEQAFFVTCDERVMTQDDIQSGRMICEVGIAPVRPAEFVIFRVFQNTAEAQR